MYDIHRLYDRHLSNWTTKVYSVHFTVYTVQCIMFIVSVYGVYHIVCIMQFTYTMCMYTMYYCISGVCTLYNVLIQMI